MAESQTNGDAAIEERRKELAKLKRPELDAAAKSAGIDNPDEIKNAEEVIQTIIDAEADARARAEAESQRAERDRNPRYSREDLIANPRFAGARRHNVVGALSTTDQEEFTAKQAEKLVSDFLARKDTTRKEVAA